MSVVEQQSCRTTKHLLNDKQMSPSIQHYTRLNNYHFYHESLQVGLHYDALFCVRVNTDLSLFYQL